MKSKITYTIHAVFPNYYDETRVAYTLKSLLDVAQSPTVNTKTYVIAKGSNVIANNVKALLPTRFLRYTMRFVGGSEDIKHQRIYRLYKKI